MNFVRNAIAAILAVTIMAITASTANAINIKKVKSKTGITAWLVEDHTVPMIAFEFYFEGGSSADPKGKAGLAHLLSATLDEGAGDLDSSAFQQKMTDISAKLSFENGRDYFYGSLKTLTRNRDEAFALLKLALNDPRFDKEPVERMRNQLVISIKQSLNKPRYIAARAWSKALIGDHPYAGSGNGTVAGMKAVTIDDLKALKARLITRSGLTIAVSGDIDEKTLAAILDDTFAGLPAKNTMPKIPEVTYNNKGATIVIDHNIPQSIIQFGHKGIMRDAPDFIPTFVMNFILGGGGFGSRLTAEVREKRGLTYSVYSALSPRDHGAYFLGAAATVNARVAETIKVIKTEISRMAAKGPTAKELKAAKSYLTGSYPLRFDSNTKIAGQLLGLQQTKRGIHYINNRNTLIREVTLKQVKDAAAKLLKPDNLIFTIVGRPEGVKSSVN